jgi:hypothetical protein
VCSSFRLCSFKKKKKKKKKKKRKKKRKRKKERENYSSQHYSTKHVSGHTYARLSVAGIGGGRGGYVGGRRYLV